jgi:hypothetical protein
MRGERPLILHMSHLFFSDVLPFVFPGPIMGTGPLLLVVGSQQSCHIEIKREIESVSRGLFTWIPMTFYHVNAREWPSIDFHGELPQDQSALLNSRLNLPMELFVVIGGMGKYVMPLAIWSPFQLL